MSGWTEDEIFFDDEDMPIEEVAWNTMLWYGEAFNRFPLLQILRERLLHVDLSRKELLAELLVPPLTLFQDLCLLCLDRLLILLE